MTAFLIKCLMFLCITNATGGTAWPSEVVKNVIRGVLTKYFANCVYFIQSPHNQGERSFS